MSQADLDTVLANAKAKGFDTSVVEYTNQDGGTSPQSNSGCSAATARRVSRSQSSAAFGLVGLGVIALLRRRRRRH
jgi:MYXO-CTERM domain-containing protein